MSTIRASLGRVRGRFAAGCFTSQATGRASPACRESRGSIARLTHGSGGASPSRRRCGWPPSALIVAAVLGLWTQQLTAQTRPSATAPATQTVVEDFDRWYAVLIEDQPAGWMHESVHTKGDHIITGEKADLTFSRGGVNLRIALEGQFVETLDGRPIESSTDQTLGMMRMRQNMRYREKDVEVSSEQGGRTQKQTLPRPAEGDYMTPAAAQQYAEEQMRKGAKEIRFRTLTAEMGTAVIETKLKVLGPEKTEVMGKVVPAIVWEVTTSAAPGVQKQYVDEAGRTIKTTMELMPGMKLTIVEADEALARAKVRPPELVASTLVKPDRRIDNPRQLKRAVYELTLEPGSEAAGIKELDLPQTGAQQVTWPGGNKKQARVVVDLNAKADGDAEKPSADYLKASPVLDSADPKVRELVETALKYGPPQMSDADKAERLRGFVHGHISQKGLAVGMATASEVARTREGDCSEHAMLLAAMLRAAQIPSRTAAGMLYVDEFLGQRNVFGYHMWTQAWIDGRWMDLDATLPDPFDATHIALGVSAMSDAAVVNDLVRMAPMIGRVKVRVVETK